MSNIESLSAKLVPFDVGTISSGPMAPIRQTGGLVFQYTPDIAESIQVNYDKSGDIIHSNESYHVFKNAENRKITLSNIIFTADTDENARYMLAAIHFFRTYQLMDYGKRGTGRPPAPMWFDAFGKYAYGKIPVLLQSVDFTISASQHDLVPVSLGGTSAERVTNTDTSGTGPRSILPPNVILDSIGTTIPRLDSAFDVVQGSTQSNTSSGSVTWLPAKLEVGSIQLVVQHSPSYWKNEFSLSKYRSGSMARTLERTASSSSIRRAIPEDIPVPRPNPRRRSSEGPTSRQEEVPVPRNNSPEAL